MVACAFLTAVSWCGVADARIGLAPVVAEGNAPPYLARDVEKTAYHLLTRQGKNPPSPGELLSALGLPAPTDIPTTEQCVAAGAALGLD